MHPRIDEMARLRAKKLTANQIAAAMKLSSREVILALEAAGLRKKRADLLSRQGEIIALYDQGLKVLEIARKLGLLAPSVRTILGRAGRTTARDNEMTPAEILDTLQRADQRWASVANGLRYEDAEEQRWSPHRWHSRSSVPGITSTAALMVEAR